MKQLKEQGQREGDTAASDAINNAFQSFITVTARSSRGLTADLHESNFPYHPTTATAAIASNTTFSAVNRHLFLARP